MSGSDSRSIIPNHSYSLLTVAGAAPQLLQVRKAVVNILFNITCRFSILQHFRMLQTLLKRIDANESTAMTAKCIFPFNTVAF